MIKKIAFALIIKKENNISALQGNYIYETKKEAIQRKKTYAYPRLWRIAKIKITEVK